MTYHRALSLRWRGPVLPTDPMRQLSRIFLTLLAFLLLASLLVVFFAVSSAPLVSSTASLTPQHIERAKRLLKSNDPRKMKSGVLRTITVSQEDLDLAVNYLAQQFGKGNSQIVLSDGAATVRASVLLPANPLGRYLNIDAALNESTRFPRFEYLRIGSVRIPAMLANALLRAGLARLQGSADYGATADTIKHVTARNGVLSVVYEWNDAVMLQLQAALVPREDQERMKAYQAHLVTLTSAPKTPRELPLGMLVQSLFSLAAERGAGVAADAAAENRAAIIVLTFYVNGKGLNAIIPSAQQWPMPVRRHVTLGGRDDFSQHFTISAALAATAGSPLSNAVGLYKEVDDSRGGSGFSFNDIAADRAGTRFGELATGREAEIQKLRRLLGKGLGDQDLLPDVKDLPEFMQEAEFKRRYGGIGAPAYLKMMDTIERRLAALPPYR